MIFLKFSEGRQEKNLKIRIFLFILFYFFWNVYIYQVIFIKFQVQVP
jgi:hypothetical protein